MQGMVSSGKYGFPKENRLLRERDFQRVYREGRLFQDELFRLFYLEKGGGPPRLGLAVGKQLGRAVVRNRVKRALREAFRLNKELFGDLDLIVQPRPEVAALPPLEIQARFLRSVQALRRRLRPRLRPADGDGDESEAPG